MLHPFARLIPALAVLTLFSTAEAGEPWQSTPSGPIQLSDPRFDDKGPGTYTYPTDRWYDRGQFDLRAVEITHDGVNATIRVTIDASIRKPEVPRLTDTTDIQLTNGIYVQNIDLHIDTVAGRGRGHTETLPGRNVRFSKDEAWDKVVVFTPRPFLTKAAIDGWLPARDVIVPTRVTSQGNTVTAIVPLIDLGGAPQAHWGYQALISGAIWQNTFQFVRRVEGKHQPNAYTMRVTTVPEPLAFGGGELGLYHPWIIDMLTPALRDQYSLLKTWDAGRKRLATVPMVYPDLKAHEAAVQHAPPLPKSALLAELEAEKAEQAPTPDGYFDLPVRDLQDGLVILARPEKHTLKQFVVGTVLNDRDERSGKVVISSIFPEFVVATVIEGSIEKVQPGMRVRFKATDPEGELP